MVYKSVCESHDLQPHASVFHDLITVEPVQQYKPAPAVYMHLAERVHKTSRSQMKEIWVISGNPFDVIGARHSGMNAIWINRSGSGWVDAAVPSLRPTATVTRLDNIFEIIDSQLKNQ